MEDSEQTHEEQQAHSHSHLHHLLETRYPQNKVTTHYHTLLIVMIMNYLIVPCSGNVTEGA